MLSMHFTIGLALTIIGALTPRIVSRAKLRLSTKFLLDLVPSLLGFAIIAYVLWEAEANASVTFPLFTPGVVVSIPTSLGNCR